MPIPDPSQVDFPTFLAKRINQFYSERVTRAWGRQHILRGRIPGPHAVQLVSNDYLCLANHPEILQVQADSVLENGNGMLMSGIFLQGQTLQNRFERAMAEFLDSPRAILCQSGWNANVGLIQSIASQTVPVYVDQLSHISLWEGAHSAGANAIIFRHNDVAHLQRRIVKHGPGIVIIDSVYSTNGSIAPIADIVALAHSQACLMVVDESHSLGTHGPQGKGLVVELGLTDKVHFRTASLAKAFAGRAGIITCSEHFFDYFMFTSRPAIFSSVVLPHDILGLHKTLEIIQAAEDRRARLHRNADRLRQGLDALGYNVNDSKSQIISVEPGMERHTMQVRDALAKHNIFGSIFCAPATAKNHPLIRLSVNADLTPEQIKRIIRAFKAIRCKVKLKEWASTIRKKRQDEHAVCHLQRCA